MNEITRENFSVAYPKLKEILETGSFVAIDFEFLGLPQSSPSTTPSILDSSCERFRKNLDSVKRYPPCQLGLTVYTEKGDGKSYDVYVYRIYLFKELEGSHQAGMAYSSISFLKRHDFDFNRWVKTGVTYTNLFEQEEIRRKLENGVAESGLFDEAFSTWLETLRTHVDFKIACEPDAFNPDIIPNEEGKDIEIELCKTVKNAASKVAMHSTLLDRSLSKLECYALLYDLTCRFPNVEFRVVKGQTLYMKRPNGKETCLDRKIKAYDDLLNAISGASSIIQCIAEHKLPIIMHNASLDILYLYQYFIDDLQGDYSTCKREIHRVFPTIIDTKCLAVMCTGLVRDHRPGLLGKLGCLRNYIELYGNSNPEDYFSSKVNLLYAKEGTIERKLISHDAAFDSMVAGEIFLKLSHMFVIARRPKTTSRAGSSSLSVKQLLYHLRPVVINKISLPFAISPIMYLAGEDEQPDHSYQLMLRKAPQSLPIFDWIPFFRPKISCDEEKQLRSLISRIGSSWKCDLRVIEDRSRILIAASGHDVYSKMYGILSSNTLYAICDSYKFYQNTGSSPRSPSPARPLSSASSVLFPLTSFMGRLVPFSQSIFVCLFKCSMSVHRNKPCLYLLTCFNLVAMAFLSRKFFIR